jgi:hypothetical protein
MTDRYLQQMQATCFATREQFDEWTRYAKRASPGRDGFCKDCTPEYQGKMIRSGRCAYPTVSFYVRSIRKPEDLDEIEGHRPSNGLTEDQREQREMDLARLREAIDKAEDFEYPSGPYGLIPGPGSCGSGDADLAEYEINVAYEDHDDEDHD